MEVEKSSGRGKGRGRGRGRKKAVENENKPPETLSFPQERSDPEPVTLDMDADITQLEAPTFSTINKGPPEPMLRLNWDHKTHLIGEKVINPMIHCCDKCESPILIYGRMIPCKHVFCLSCAEREGKVCPRCQEKIVRIEKTGLGTVFMCTFGGSRYGNTGCRRTYLSQRDLQAHINHRHVTGSQNKEHITASGVIPSVKTSLSSSNRLKTAAPLHAVANDPRVQNNSTNDYFHKIHTQSGHSTPSSQHQTSRQQQSQHQHSSLSHSQDTQQSHQHTMHSHSHPNSLSSSQLHLSVSGSQQLLQSDFNSPLLVPNYPPPSTHSGAVNSSSSLRGNLITVPINDSNVDSVNSIGIPLPPGFSHQGFTPQFSQGSSGIPFPVPPPGQLPNMGQLPQSLPQFFPSSPANYTTSAQQRTPAFSPSQQTQTIMNQSIMTSRAPPMVPPPRISQFPSEPTIQSFNMPPPHRWHPPPNQTHFY